ncbi:hypothetical protein PVAND_013119 [Polypedilum vanderplanki]|uniref:Fatty acyl-CoA reductase n=1 Tax=Polypedilum vanderplanki TaxID=319348 RepID=A0A9J6CNN9_POLVA|nr:hypothetical protein PVAND_013119 [Polypedilum vanderplanki]
MSPNNLLESHFNMEIDLSKYIRKKTAEELQMDENNNLEDFSKNPLIKTRCIKDYYDNCNIFVTGSTGFLGKVLIEKLLRSCDGIRKIYILLRPKRGIGSEQRFEEYLRNPIFERIRNNNPDILKKLYCIPGDINESNLGLHARDIQLLQQNIDIVFHVAATVRFNEPLKVAANLNTFGTRRVMELCTKMTKLKSLVHVSTAYSNPNLKNVDEQVYGTTSTPDHHLFINSVGILPDEFTETIANRFNKRHPNTYTLTKHMAEHIVLEYNNVLPLCIVRPSIVTAAVNEPYPGWIDNIYGITGILMEIGRGTITTIMGVEEGLVDLMPVDIVCNTLITAGWANSFIRTPNEITVYNCTSGHFNPMNYKELRKHILKYSLLNPSKYIAMYPNFVYRKSRLMHNIIEIFMHFLPALMFDVLLRMQGKKPIMFKIAKRVKIAQDTGDYFVLNDWNFNSKNLKRIIRAANQTQLDANEFCCDVTSLDWDDYIGRYMMGIRTYVLKDDISSLPKARQKLQKIYYMKLFLQFLLFATIYFVFYGIWN